MADEINNTQEILSSNVLDLVNEGSFMLSDGEVVTTQDVMNKEEEEETKRPKKPRKRKKRKKKNCLKPKRRKKKSAKSFSMMK